MGIFNNLWGKKLFGKKDTPVEKNTKVVATPKVKKPRKPKQPKVELTAKEKATQAGEPYVAVLSMDIDPNNVHEGAFELDWNEIFIARLVKAGYMRKKEDTDTEIIERWFQDVARNIALEMYEQVQADPLNRDVRPINTKDLGNGRTEVS